VLAQKADKTLTSRAEVNDSLTKEDKRRIESADSLARAFLRTIL
jgi:hypothetical protein